MTIFDLVLLLTALIATCTLGNIGYLLARSRWRSAGRRLLLLCALLGSYALALITVSLTSPQRILALHQPRCFDDWCLQAEQVTGRKAVGRSPLVVAARGRYVVVTVQVLSQARRASQRALDAHIYLLDAGGRRYDPDATAQRALDRQGVGGYPLDSLVEPGGSFTRTVAFDVPAHPGRLDLVVAHGLFPDLLVIGDAQSFLHGPTVIALTGSS